MSNTFHELSRSKGWWEKETGPDGELIHELVTAQVPIKLVLIHSEVSEALEEYRNGTELSELTYEPDGKPVGFPSEIADIVIRCYDLAGALGFSLDHAIDTKHAYNQKRPHRHGGKLA